MNVEHLESIIRDELRRDAAGAPSGQGVRAAVLDAVTGMPVADRPVRRWTVPLLVAAAVVALAVAATLLPRTFGGHSQPAHPKPAPSLPTAPTSDLQCANGQQRVTGAGARYSNSAGDDRYAYEYYCAAPDGSRGGSFVRSYRMVDGRLVYDQTLLTGVPPQYVMSIIGSADALRIRVYDTHASATLGGPTGEVDDMTFDVDTDSGADVRSVATACLATDLSVKVSQANEPTLHEVLRLTNHSRKACAVWGNPRYSWADKAYAGTARSVVRGPAGGLAAGEFAAPPLLLQPGETASAAIGWDTQSSGDLNCPLSALSATLANGVRLGVLNWDTCHLVSYPLVRADNGSMDHPESEAPALSTSGSCGVTTTEIELGFGPTKPVTGGRVGMALTVSAHGATTCTIGGFPNVRALDAGGNLLAIASQQPLPGVPTGLVTVSPGHPASALVDWTRTASGACYPNGHLQLALAGNGYGFNQLLGRFCDLQVHQFVAGSTGGG